MSNSAQLERVDASPSLKDRAYSAIKDAILSLRLEPGSPIVETNLAEQLGISKTPVRDALQELEREGFVTRVFFKGTYVTDVTMKDIREVFELRAVLEGLAARIAASLFEDDELRAVARHLAQARLALEGGDLVLCSQHGQQIHHAIRQRIDNERLAVIIGNLDDHLRRFRGISDQISGRLKKSLAEHERVLDALQRRDPEAAEQAMRDHLFSVLYDLQETGLQRHDGDENE